MGLQLRERMKEKDFANLENDTTESAHIICTENQLLPITLEKPDWSFLVGSLLKEYKRLVDLPKTDENKGIQSTVNRLIDTKFVNQSLYINVELEEKTPTPEPMEIERMTSSPIPMTETQPVEDKITEDPAISHEHVIHTTEKSLDISGNSEEFVDSHKRKREDEEEEGGEGTGISNHDNSNSENDEESEAEEKRLSLR